MDGISASQMVSHIMSRTEQPPAATEALGNRFSELLSHAPVRERMSEVGKANVISDMVAHHEEALANLEREIERVSTAKHMSMTELSAKTIDLMRQSTMMSMNIDGATALAKSAKNSLQTLMKNQ